MIGDIQPPRSGDEILPWAIDITQRANRKITGQMVVPHSEGWLIRDPEEWPDNDLTPFELYDDITPGQTDKLAWPLKSDYTRDDSTDPPTLKVSDKVLGDVRAYGSNHGWSTATNGAKGWYIVGPDGTNQIVAIQRLSKECKAVTESAGGVNSGDGTFTVNAVVPLDDGQSPVAVSTDSLTVANWCGWQADTAGRPLHIVPDGTGGWRFEQGGCWPPPAS